MVQIYKDVFGPEKEVIVLYVMGSNESNIVEMYSQIRWLMKLGLTVHSMYAKYRIYKDYHRTFDNLTTEYQQGYIVIKDDALIFDRALHLQGKRDITEISVIYFRTGYRPEDYPTNE